MKYKCNKCGKTDSTHVKHVCRSILAMAYGLKDPTDGLQQYYIYCKECNIVNVYKPKLFGKKFDRFRDDFHSISLELSAMDGSEAKPVPARIVKDLALEMVELFISKGVIDN